MGSATTSSFSNTATSIKSSLAGKAGRGKQLKSDIW